MIFQVPSVATHVVASKNCSRVLSNDQNGLGADLGSEVIAGLRDVCFESSEEPGLGPHPFPLETRELRGQIAFLGNQGRSELRHR